MRNLEREGRTQADPGVAFDYLASSLGASTDEGTLRPLDGRRPVSNIATTVKLIASFLLSYPLAAILKRLPDDNPTYKNVFNIS